MRLLILCLLLTGCKSVSPITSNGVTSQQLVAEIDRLRYENDRLRSGLYKEPQFSKPLPVDTAVYQYPQYPPVPLRGTNLQFSSGPPQLPNVVTEYRTNVVYVATNSSAFMLVDPQWLDMVRGIPVAADRESVRRYKARKEAEQIMLEQLEIIKKNQ